MKRMKISARERKLAQKKQAVNEETNRKAERAKFTF